jgi:hypothetical protein
VGDNVGDGDNCVDNAGNDAGKGDCGDASREGGGALGRGSGGGDGNCGGGSCILQGSFAFIAGYFVWYFYDVWGELARSHLPLHSCRT